MDPRTDGTDQGTFAICHGAMTVLMVLYVLFSCATAKPMGFSSMSWLFVQSVSLQYVDERPRLMGHVAEALA